MKLHLPEGYACKTVKCDAVKCKAENESENILAVIFVPKKTGDYSFVLNF
jgi:hypothetical protein